MLLEEKCICFNFVYQVMVSFDNKILRGNRTSKKDSSSFDAFWSPNLPPLANLEIKVTGMKITLLKTFTVITEIIQFISHVNYWFLFHLEITVVYCNQCNDKFY